LGKEPPTCINKKGMSFTQGKSNITFIVELDEIYYSINKIVLKYIKETDKN
jgi:hypothetical protein